MRRQPFRRTLSVVWSVSNPMGSVLAPTIPPRSQTSCWIKRSVESPISRIGTRLPAWVGVALRSWSASGCNLQRVPNSFQSCFMPSGWYQTCTAPTSWLVYNLSATLTS